MFEVLYHYLPQIEKSDVLQRLHLEKEKFFVVSLTARKTSIVRRISMGDRILNLIAELYGFPIICDDPPQNRKMLESKR
jgi:UDP-N-acetylglucosamine 2-epimerase (non-hydrolysing)